VRQFFEKSYEATSLTSIAEGVGIMK